jgi:hypothetical protein
MGARYAGSRMLVVHQRRTAETVRSVPLCVAGSASNACFPFAAHSSRACSPWSLWSLSAIQSSAPRMVARSSPVRSTTRALTTRPPSSMRCRVRLRRSTCHVERRPCCGQLLVRFAAPGFEKTRSRAWPMPNSFRPLLSRPARSARRPAHWR